MRTALAALARPAARAVHIRRTGPASPSRTTRRSISFRKISSMTDCRECAATATAVPRCPARSASRPRAGSTHCGPKSAAPACPAMSNAAWRERGMGWRCWRDSSSPRTRGTIRRALSIGAPALDTSSNKTTGIMGPCVRRDDAIAEERSAHAVTACAKSSSSSSSSTGEKVLSGLVESVIGLRLP